MNSNNTKSNTLKLSFDDWTNRVMATAVDDNTWEPLLESLHAGVKDQINQLSIGKRFSELTESEQSALVERSFHETQQNEKGETLVTKFSHRLGKAVNDELIHFLLESSLKNKDEDHSHSNIIMSEHPSNADQMLEIFSVSVIDMLESSPPEMASTLRLFINRPLPECLRSNIWTSCLTKKLNTAIKSNAGGRRDRHTGSTGMSAMLRGTTSKLAPSLDVILARRCHSILDCSFYELSSRSNASFVKVVVSNFMRMIGLKLPASPTDSFDETDQIAYLIIPLVCVFRLSSTNRKHITEKLALKSGPAVSGASKGNIHKGEDEASTGGSSRSIKNLIDLELIEDTTIDSKNIMERPNAIETALYTLLEPRNMSLLSADDGKFLLTSRAPFLGRTIALLLSKDAKFSKILQSFRSANTAITNSPRDGAGNQKESVNSPSPAFSSAPNLEAFINEQLKRGLSGLLNLRTCLFVWDQGFVVGFASFFPVVVVSLLLGAAEELKGLTSLKAIFETFCSYCLSVSIESLQRLLSDHCAAQLREMFDSGGSYSLDYGENQALQAIHKHVMDGVVSAIPISSQVHESDSVLSTKQESADSLSAGQEAEAALPDGNAKVYALSVDQQSDVVLPKGPDSTVALSTTQAFESGTFPVAVLQESIPQVER